MMLHNFLANSRGIHFEAATCEPLSRRPQTRGRSCVWTCLVTCFISRPLSPPFLDQIPNSTPPSPSFLPISLLLFSYLFLIQRASLIASRRLPVVPQLLGSPLYLPHYRLKELCKCPAVKLPDVNLCNADALTDAMKAIDV